MHLGKKTGISTSQYAWRGFYLQLFSERNYVAIKQSHLSLLLENLQLLIMLFTDHTLTKKNLELLIIKDKNGNKVNSQLKADKVDVLLSLLVTSIPPPSPFHHLSKSEGIPLSAFLSEIPKAIYQVNRPKTKPTLCWHKFPYSVENLEPSDFPLINLS